MSDAEWDADDFEPANVGKPAINDKWEGEDEEDDVKDSWDMNSEDEEEKKVVAPVKKKKTLEQKIKEREEKKRAELELKRQKEEESRELTPEEKLAEKLKQQKMLEDADLELAKDAFGVSNDELSGRSIDSCNPVTKEDFDYFGELLKTKITAFERSPCYVIFLESLFRDLSCSLEADDLKKLGSTLNALSNEKTKQSKAGKGKKKNKKATLSVSKTNDFGDDISGAYGDEYDDFI